MEDVGDCGCSCEVFDIMTFILIFLLDKISCCNIEIGKKYLLKYRMCFGLVMSIVDFSAICITNKDYYLDDDVRKGLFGFIICFICIAYCVLLIGCENIIIHMRLYKSCDVAMDGLLLAYNYAIDGSATEPFSIICTVVGVLDMSIALLTIFCCGQNSCLKTNTSDKESKESSKTNVIKPTTTNNSTNPNNNSEQRIENRRNINHVPHNSMGHTTNYSHKHYTHHGNGMQQGFGNGMQHQYPAYQTVPQNTRPRHQDIIIVSQARQ